MEKFGKSQSVSRTEDHRFLTGKGQYVDDIAPDGALFAFVFRSPVAHGDITELDVADARASAGVKAVITAEDLRALNSFSFPLTNTIKHIKPTTSAEP